MPSVRRKPKSRTKTKGTKTKGTKTKGTKTKGLKYLKKETKKRAKSKVGTRRKHTGGAFNECDRNRIGICVTFDKYKKDYFTAKMTETDIIVNKISPELKNMGVLDGTTILEITQNNNGTNALTSLETNPVKSDRHLRALLKTEPLQVVFKEKFEEVSLTPSMNDDMRNMSISSEGNAAEENSAAEEGNAAEEGTVNKGSVVEKSKSTLSSAHVGAAAEENTVKDTVKYYACCKGKKAIGSGAFKNVYTVTDDPSKALVPDISYNMTTEQAKKAVFIVPKSQLEPSWKTLQNNDKMGDLTEFLKEMNLQKNFANIGIAPKVLYLQSSNPNEHFFAVTDQCNFSTIPSKPFNSSKNKLKELFDTMATNGYIYTDIKIGNICYDEEKEKFIFVDFDNTFCYEYDDHTDKYSEIDTTAKSKIISDIMEFMFLLVELKTCGTRTRPTLCMEKNQIVERLKQIIQEYSAGGSSSSTTPMYSNSGETLLEMGSPDEDLSPIHMLGHYVANSTKHGDKRSRSVLTGEIKRLLSVTDLDNIATPVSNLDIDTPPPSTPITV
jgi:hypothetical protein